VRNAYLADGRDTRDGPVVVHRDGTQAPMEPGSWVVNCTGILLKSEGESESASSELGTVLNLTTGASFAFLSSMGGYFLTHLWFRGQLGLVPVSLMDHRRLLRSNPKAYLLSSSVQSVYNYLLMSLHLPGDVIERCHLMFDRWYPAPRRWWMMGKLRVQRASMLEQIGETLAELDRRYDVSRPAVPPAQHPPRLAKAQTAARQGAR